MEKPYILIPEPPSRGGIISLKEVIPGASRVAGKFGRILAGERLDSKIVEEEAEIGEIVLEARGIRKAFGSVVANDGIDFEVKAGEIHALLGENGAGKTALVKILYGIYRCDEGAIRIGGEEVEITSPTDARDLGIGMVHQHFMLVDPNTVAENVALGLPGGRFMFPEQEVKDRIKRYSSVYGLKVDPDDRVWQISAGEKQTIEILKALFSGARVIILDEPTAVLTPIETADLFEALRLMARRGKAVIFITHKLGEVIELSDRVTVLRKGKVVGCIDTRDTSREELARMMVGGRITPSVRESSERSGKTVLEVDGLSVMGDRGTMAVRNVSFKLDSGEILGLAGVAGNGQRELVEALTGLRSPVSGRVEIEGTGVTYADPRTLASMGVAYIPEDRMELAIVGDLSVSENLVLRKYWQEPFSKGISLDDGAIESYASEMIEEYNIVTPSKDTPARKLSGGNIQRLVLARETSRHPKMIIASHPTSGLDVKAANDIRGRLLEESNQGASILMDSEDLDEIFMLSDRIAVMSKGEIVDIVPRDDATKERIGLLMGGALSK